MLEIERKYLIPSNYKFVLKMDSLLGKDFTYIAQGYLTTVDGEVRVRSKTYQGASKYTLTIKSQSNTHVREETELDITQAMYEDLYNKCTKTLAKKRYDIEAIEPGIKEVCLDVFLNPMPLMMLEVEFQSQADCAKFDIGCLRLSIPMIDVSLDPKYKNANIAIDKSIRTNVNL